MNNEKNNFTSNSPIIDNKTIEDIYKENFKKYFQEIHKVMPHYLQNITQLQESFFGGMD